METINKRRSIRKYTDQKVEEEKIVGMLKAAMNAPTARNTQEWTFKVIANRQMLDQIAQNMSSMTMAAQAGYGIVVCGDRNKQSDEFIYTNGGAAVQNMLLEATDLGLGTCWCAIGPREERMEYFVKLLDLPENELPVAFVAVGYPKEEKEPNNRYDENKVTYYR